MFEKIKKILLDEIKDQVEEAKKLLEEIKRLGWEQATLEEPEYEELYEPKDPKKLFGFFEKITNYGEYKKRKKEYPKKYSEYIKHKIRRDSALERYEKRKNEIENRLKELNLKSEDLKGIIEKYEKIKNAYNLKDLGITIEEAIKLCKEKGIPFVLDETDKIVLVHCDFDKLEDLVLIHKTNFTPSNDEIKTTTNSNKYHEEQIGIGDKKIDIRFQAVRDTVHFAVNGEVGSHFYGNWEDCRYAIVIPLVDVPNLVSITTGDTFSLGNVDISKGYLLCPEAEMEEVKEKNPNLTVIGYKGTNVKNFANRFISMLGYKYESVASHGWENADSDRVERTVRAKTNLETVEHCYTKYFNEEDIRTGINQFKAIIEKLFETNIEFDPKEATIQLMGDGEKIPQLRITDKMFYENDGKYLIGFIEDLKQYNINIPNYINQIYSVLYDKKQKGSKTIDDTDAPEDLKKYIKDYEELRESNKRRIHFSEELEFALTYEILKQIKELNKKNIETNEDDKTL
ncbi:MAG: hypothetical protein IKR57_01410 [Bacilli bacterium]|nr:hypothetical protein [Bacilli bacterium]